MAGLLSPEAFSALTLEKQLEHLEQSLSTADPRTLLELCAGIRDHAPLAWLSRKLVERRWLGAEANRLWFAEFLIRQSETAVNKVLKGWVTTRKAYGARAKREIPETLIVALRSISIERLSSMCLIDRFLKHNFSTLRDAFVEEQVQRCEQAIGAGRIAEVSVALLAQVPARAMPRLSRAAEQAGLEVTTALKELRRELAVQTVKVLGQAPKAVSQSNAEELLSRRVYTDPGHFLIELLQNAEDCGAEDWRLDFEPRRVVVWHNGTSFDARDVVGVCSIGQTTKRKQQIGFFGVGFKSVYEVTDRPQIYSADYQFEIADVSIPKLLDRRPPDVPADGTVLVLPLRDPRDSVRSPEALFAMASELDPMVLFTLRQIDRIELRLRREDGSSERYAIHEEREGARRWSRIRQEPEGWVRGYVIQDDEYDYDLGFRAPGRPDSTRVMVGARLDEGGVPQPLPEEAATIYSYLPTEQHSGLRFFVQGHFDVPVDRERITEDSSWNRWILSKVPYQLERLAQRLLEGSPRDEARRRALGLLDILPLDKEMGSPVFRQVPAGLGRAMAELPMMPCTDGELHRPRETIIAPPVLAALFAGEPLRDPRTGGLGYFLEPNLDERSVAVARNLGCTSFDIDALVELLSRWLEDVDDGANPSREQAPRFLSEPSAGALAELYDLLLHELEELERTGRRGASFALVARLRTLPIVLGATGGLFRAGTRSKTGPARGARAIRVIFGRQRTFVHDELDSEPLEEQTDEEQTGEPPAMTRAAAFLDRLGVPRLGLTHVVRALEEQFEGVETPLVNLDAVAFPEDQEGLEIILRQVAEANSGIQSRVARLPLFPAVDGRLYPLARIHTDRSGLLAVETGTLSEELCEFYGSCRPLAGPSTASGPVADLLTRLSVPTLSLRTLITDLRDEEGPLDRSLAGLRRLHQLLEKIRGDIPERLSKELARLPIWPDEAGRGRRLRGEELVYIPAYPEIRQLFPEAAFLDDEVGSRSHVGDVGVDKIGVKTVVDALSPDAKPPLKIAEDVAVVSEHVLPLLLDHADRIGARSRERLSGLSIFVSDRGRMCRLAELSTVEDPALRRLYGDFPGRAFLPAEGASRALVERLEMGSRLIDASARTLVADLEGLTMTGQLTGGKPGEQPLPLVGDARHLEQLHEYLALEAPKLTRRVLRQALAVSVYPDERGVLGPLEGSSEESSGAVRIALDGLGDLLRAGGARLLEEEARKRLEPLLQGANAPRAGLEALLDLLDRERAGSGVGDVSRVLADTELRRGFYQWLVEHESEAFVVPRCREALTKDPLFTTETGRFVPAADLVIDRELPDLGIDWKPHTEIPEALLQLLVRHLNIGKPNIGELARRHLLPAYLKAVESGQIERAGALLVYLARRSSGRDSPEIRRALETLGAPIPIEDQSGALRPPGELVLPTVEVAALVEAALGATYPRPSTQRYPEDVHAFLRVLGVVDRPPLELIARTMDSPLPESTADVESGRALAALCGHLYRTGPEEVCERLPLRSAAWLIDGTGRRRRPGELFVPTMEVKTLVGDFAELFPDEQVPGRLGDELCATVGLKQEADVTAEDVLRHILASAERGTAVPFRVYLWLDRGLAEGWLDPGALFGLFGDERWISTDDDDYRNHADVLGISAIPYFGGRRGYWEKGSTRCPTLCRAFRIPNDVTARVVVEFLREVGKDVAARGDRQLLEEESALPRMLLNCYELLGEEEQVFDPDIPVVLCRQRGLGEEETQDGLEALRLLPARDGRLLRSDTPTLEHLFEDVGTFFVASKGAADQRVEVDRFYELLGIRRLREAYTINVSEGGRDRTEELQFVLPQLERTASALLSVLPRIRRQLTLLSPDGWVEKERLVGLIESKAFRVIEGLSITYRIEEIGEVSTEMKAVYDPTRRALLLDASLVEDLMGNAMDLASGLVPCIYDGQGEDVLISLIQILLGLSTRERMDAYLDQRHFPAGDEAPLSARERLMERLGEILDYGLDARLAGRFPELAGRDLELWRSLEVLSRAVPDSTPGEGDEYLVVVGRAVPLLLDAIDLNEPSEELGEALVILLSAKTLAEVPTQLYSSADRAADDELRPMDSPRGSTGIQSSLPGSSSNAPLPDVTGRATPVEGRTSATKGSNDWTTRSFDELLRRLETEASAGSTASGEAADPLTGSPAPRVEAEYSLARGTESFWGRVARFLGFGAESPVDSEAGGIRVDLPRWAGPSSNNFALARGIGPQLWATRSNVEKISSQPPAAQLAFSPSLLPVPYRYAVRDLGATFDPRTQTWSSRHAPAPVAPAGARLSGKHVVFQGKLVPGHSQLPIPLWSRLASLPQVVEGETNALDLRGVEVGQQMVTLRIRGSRALVIRYEVELFRAPVLTNDEALQRDFAVLGRCTLTRGELPTGVSSWLESRRRSGGTPWEHAVAVQQFVSSRYVYDEDFMDRPEVGQELQRLVPGLGNHHLQILHAAAGGGALGRGICYELNTLVVELLRHLGVPAMVATGWVLDRGVVDRPDHLFALALLGSAEGDCFVPLDAATGPQGPLRPLADHRSGRGHSAVPWGLAPRPGVPAVPGPWSSAPVANLPEAGSLEARLAAHREAERQRLEQEMAHLIRLIRLVCAVERLHPPPTLDAYSSPCEGRELESRVAKLESYAEQLLAAPGLVEAMLSIMRGELDIALHQVPSQVQELARRGLVQIQQVPSHRIWPSDQRGP